MSQKWQKLIRALQSKKHRQAEGLFLVEGAKNLQELAGSSFEVVAVFLGPDFHKENPFSGEIPTVICETDTFEKVGNLMSNNAGIAVVKTNPNRSLCVEGQEFILVLDDIRDPGNLGTIIRVADWYGISKIICSETCVDFYNPKTIAATMGSFTRTNVFYTQIADFLANTTQPIFGTFLKGATVHGLDFGQSGYIVIGSESHGISPEIEQLITQKITIPKFGHAESLNAGIATAIVLDNLMQRFGN